MNSSQVDSNNGTHASNNKQQQLDLPPSRSSFFSSIFAPINLSSKSSQATNNNNNNGLEHDKKHDNSNIHHSERAQNDKIANSVGQPMPKRACRAPLSRKFAHPCTCSQSNSYHKSHSNNSNSTGYLPPAAYTTPLHLWDPVTKKCLPTSRSRDMLLKECRPNVASPYPLPHQLYHGAPCVYDELVCDARRNRCICKPSLHLYYESNFTSFGCVPIGPTIGPNGAICRSGYIYNVISRECQKIFDVNELPPTYTTGVSATQFSFVTIVLIWILLLILIVTAKLRKFRTSNLYRNSPNSERRLHHGNSYRQHNRGASAWLNPFIAAVNGHHHLNQHRTTIERHSQAIDDSGNYNDTDFFLSNGRRVNEMFPDNNFAGSQQSLNNPPPKFEEIYPTCPELVNIQPPSNEDLPSYDEAMKLQNTMPPPDINPKE